MYMSGREQANGTQWLPEIKKAKGNARYCPIPLNVRVFSSVVRLSGMKGLTNIGT